MKLLNIIGAGLAGSEAAWQAAELGIKVNLYAMCEDKQSFTAAHKTWKVALFSQIPLEVMI